MSSPFTSDSSASAIEIPRLEQYLNTHPDSPLFARLADLYLRENRPSDALKLLLEGLRRFPSYPTALYILSKTQVMLRRYIDARSTLETLLLRLPGCDSAVELLERMQDLELKYPPAASVGTGVPGSSAVARSDPANSHWSRRDDLLPGFDIIIDRDRSEPDTRANEAELEIALDTVVGLDAVATLDEAAAREEVAVTAGVQAEGKTVLFDKTATEEEHAVSDTEAGEKLETLAMRLDGAKIPPLAVSENPVVPGDDAVGQSIEEINLASRPITETLVTIYIQQGKIKEAIEGYRLMAARDPERAEYFKEKAVVLEQDIVKRGINA